MALPRSGARLGSLPYTSLLTTRLPVRCGLSEAQACPSLRPSVWHPDTVGRDAGRGRPVLRALEPSRQLRPSPALRLRPQGLCRDLPGPVTSHRAVRGRLTTEAKSTAGAKPLRCPAQTTGRCWRLGLLWDFTKQTNSLAVRSVLPQVRATVPGPGPLADRSRGLDRPRDAHPHVQGDAEWRLGTGGDQM